MLDGLALRDNAKNALMEIKSVEGGMEYLNKIIALETWVKAEKKDAELQNMVAEQKLRTQRILGRLIQEGQKKNEIAKKGETESNSLINVGDKKKKKLSDIGLTANQSSTFQKIFSIPTETFEEAIEANKKAVDDAVLELTTAGFVRLADKLNADEESGSEKIESFDRFKLIGLLQQHKITQYQLAMGTMLETATISRLCAGTLIRPTFDAIARIAEFFKVPMEYFKTGDLL